MVGTRIILTLHNSAPHDLRHPTLDALANWCMAHVVEGVVVLESSQEALARARFPKATTVVAPLGQYDVSSFVTAASRAPSDLPTILHHGLQRRYKGAAALIAASNTCEVPHELKIIGRFERDYVQHCRDLVSGNHHATIDDRFVSMQELIRVHASADVVVIPYAAIENPSSFLLSLQLKVPVAGPNLDSLQRLRERVGAEWVYLWDGVLDGEKLEAILSWAQVDRWSAPDLTHYSWGRYREIVGELYAAVSGLDLTRVS
jgi:beta-1,4-mannosyltransferase